MNEWIKLGQCPQPHTNIRTCKQTNLFILYINRIYHTIELTKHAKSPHTNMKCRDFILSVSITIPCPKPRPILSLKSNAFTLSFFCHIILCSLSWCLLQLCFVLNINNSLWWLLWWSFWCLLWHLVSFTQHMMHVYIAAALNRVGRVDIWVGAAHPCPPLDPVLYQSLYKNLQPRLTEKTFTVQKWYYYQTDV